MSKMIDLTGQDFGYWHVIKRAEENSSSGKAMWICKCTLCNKTIKPVVGSHLRSGRSTSCGCTRIEKMKQGNIIDKTGQTFGFLKVKRLATEEEKPKTLSRGTWWICDCLKCGRENICVKGDNLGRLTNSCGCITSLNESKIASMLDTLGIKYKKEFTFEDLYQNVERNKLRFDIAVFNKDTLLYLIEYDGIQHFQPKHFKDTIITTHERDLLKNKYCFEHNIPLIRIPYDEEYTINDIKIETTRFLLTKQNEEEYYNSRMKE